MNTVNRFVKNNTQILRVFNGQEMTIRSIAKTNIGQAGEFIPNLSNRLNDVCFTVNVEYNLSGRGIDFAKIVLKGSLAEQALRDGLRPGDKIVVDGQESKKHFVHANWFERVIPGVVKKEDVLR